MKTKALIIKLIIGLILITGCAPAIIDEAGVSSAPQAWFDAPLPGTIHLPPNPCTIVAHGASPVGILQFDLSINGGATTNIPSPDTSSSLVTLTQDCGVSQPGEYLLQIRAQDNDGNWSGYAETSLIIPGDATTISVPAVITPASANPTFTAIPTLTAAPAATSTPQPIGAVGIQSISTNLVYLGGTTCGPVEVNIVAHATAPAGITTVILFYRFQTSNASTEFMSVAMDPLGGNLYGRVINPTSALGGVIPFDAAILQYQVVVQQTDDDTSIRTPVLGDINVQACGATSACLQYTDERACIANSCKWRPIPGTRTIGCQTP